MDSKLFLSCFLVFCSCFYVAYTTRELQSLDDGLALTAGGGGDTTKCVTKLLPCKPYLNSSSTPPATCCVPLKSAVNDDAECLCNVLDNPGIMKSFNVSVDDALKLAKSCGANADLSKCQNATPPRSSPPSNSSSGGSTSNNAGGTSSSSNVAGSGVSHFVGVNFITFLVGLLAV